MALINAALGALCLVTVTAGSDYYITVPGVGSLVGGPSRKEGVAAFLGIPYAKPPLGDLRWQPPQQHEPWQSPRRATSFGNVCLQTSGGDEDCLFLNVYTPEAALQSQRKLPVMIWIHGGGYQFGESNDYEGAALVSGSNRSIVSVAINYRLNIFGFLCGPEIRQRTSDWSCGNFGIQDQRLAMEWVSKHIAAFGGDANDVTIFGESAGGNSVLNHLAQPASFKFYKNAIVESGAYNVGAITMEAATKDYASLLKATRCSSIACLLTKSGKEIIGKGYGTGPVIDGVSLTAAPAVLISQGKHNKAAPVILGSNRDEDASPWFDSHRHNMNELMFDFTIGAEYGFKNLPKIKRLYDRSVYPYPSNLGGRSQWWWAASRISTDAVPGLGPCGARWLAKTLLRGGSSDVYTYLFAHPPQFKNPGIPGTGPGSVIVPHACEIPFVFDATDQLVKGEESELASRMSHYWINFAATGNPNSQGLPTWPLYALDTDEDLRFDVGANGIAAEQHLRKEACDYWESEFFNKVSHSPMPHSATHAVIV